MLKELPVLSATDADQALYGMFDTRYSIFDHTDKLRATDRPLALVALHESEENSNTSSLYEQIELYIKLDIYKHIGVSLNEYLNYPREIVNMIKIMVKRKNDEENKTVSDIQNSLNKVGKS